MFARESPDDQCTIINIVASDCICSDVFKRTLVPYVAFTFCRKVSHQLTVLGPVKIMGKVLSLYRNFKEPFQKIIVINTLVIECEKQEPL